MDELTPWEEINPPMVSAQPQEQRLPSSERLHPATSEQFRNELTACLTLVAPVGMTEEAKRDWLSVAWATVGHLPADLLAMGCRAARTKCDHPSKIVPTIIAETQELLNCRRSAAQDERPQHLRLSKPDYVTPEEAAKILKEFGLKPSIS